MASVRKLAGGNWRAEVARQGVRKSKVFDSKTAAKEWAAREEYLILHAKEVQAQGTFSEALDRYAREVSPSKRGARWEIIRIEKLRRDKLADMKLSDMRASDFADWRDRRLKEVAPASVIREMQIMSAVMSIAVREWGIISASPLSDVRRPKKPPARDRLPTDDDIKALRISAGEDLTRATARAFHAFLFALETAMRAGEICGLTWGNLDLKTRVAHLPITKNGHPRDVPLSREAIRLIEALPKADPVFDLTTQQLDVLWRKLRDRSGVSGLTFHDSRHGAITRLASRVEVLSLARMVGHRDIRQLSTYYNESASDLAKRLD